MSSSRLRFPRCRSPHCPNSSDPASSSSSENIPTLGTVAITMALHNCDEVAVAGFGYDMSMPHAPLHYYETVKMSAIKEVGVVQEQFTW
uniref:Uncharacterized protein n=1 Tax=Knipowitschia caucasica TaxID=637954 RepID=A0AAV2JRL2_KNICA